MHAGQTTGRCSPRNPSIRRLTSPPNPIPSTYRRPRQVELQHKTRRHLIETRIHISQAAKLSRNPEPPLIWMASMSKLRAGDWVEVRSKEEILKSLDKNGRLEGLPFMPQMFQYCGQRFRVFKRAHKTCDTVEVTRGRLLPNGIHLDLRCDGQSYGGCQASCLIFWKQEWLKPINENTDRAVSSSLGECRQNDALVNEASCTEEEVWKATRVKDQQAGEETRYICQATQLLDFTTRLRWWDIRQYVEDYTSGNASLGSMFRGFIYLVYYHGAQTWRNKIGRPSRWLYGCFQSL